MALNTCLCTFDTLRSHLYQAHTRGDKSLRLVPASSLACFETRRSIFQAVYERFRAKTHPIHRHSTYCIHISKLRARNILVPRAHDPSGMRQESRALGATISGMRHRCKLRETGWAGFGYFLCYSVGCLWHAT